MAKKQAAEERNPAGFNRMLALGGVLLIVMLLVGAYFLIKYISAPPPDDTPSGVGPSPTPPPAEDEYATSPLVAQFGIDSSPVLIFNCKYMREGTFATKERQFRITEGTERQDIINALCEASDNPAICEFSAPAAAAVRLVPLSSSSCAGSKVRVYAFYSPSCGNSANQREVLEEIESMFTDEIEVIYVCTPVFDGDFASCMPLVRSGAYDE